MTVLCVNEHLFCQCIDQNTEMQITGLQSNYPVLYFFFYIVSIKPQNSTNGYNKWTEKSPWEFYPRQKSISNRKKLRGEDAVFPMEGRVYQWAIQWQMVSPDNVTWIDQIIVRSTYMHTYMCVCVWHKCIRGLFGDHKGRSSRKGVKHQTKERLLLNKISLWNS